MSFDFTTDQDLRTLPEGVSIRFIITGLVICDLNPAANGFQFLQHVKNHQPTLSVELFTKDGNSEGGWSVGLRENGLLNIALPPSKNFDATMPTYGDELVSFNKLHGVGGHSARPNSVRVPNRVLISNCRFRVGSLTALEYTLTDGRVSFGPRNFCQALVGDFSGENDLIKIDQKEINTATHNALITLHNHCFRGGEPCRSPVAAPYEDDFHYYYDVHQDNQDERRVFRTTQFLKSPFVGACLPVCEICV